ncbi:MAG: Crp/Fnr family transcriptional regulator [Bacilli bacterium]|nr:Crp/Fnr family transcriptional regulator [Bacilli bacterium]
MKINEFKMFKNANHHNYNNYFKTIDYQSNAMIFNEGDECTNISFILEGTVSIRTYSLNGKEEILNTLHPGEIFGDVICFSGNKKYIGHVIADKNCKIAHVNKNNWLKLIQKDSAILTNFIENITDKTFKTKMENKMLLHKNIEDRIYYYLNTKLNKKSPSTVIIKNVTELAKILNLPRPSVSRSLNKMEKRGLIKRNKNKIEVL